MPTIQSKKYPDNIQFIDAEGWANMKRIGKDRNFKIIDDGDMADTVIATPEKIIDFSDTVSIQSEDNVENILSRDGIKDKLDKLEVEYNTRASTDKLLELLNNQ